MWIAREGFTAPVPEPWQQCVNDKGEVYYVNGNTKDTTWDHPLDEHYKKLCIEEKRKRDQKPAGKERAAPEEKKKKEKVEVIEEIQDFEPENVSPAVEVHDGASVEKKEEPKPKPEAEPKPEPAKARETPDMKREVEAARKGLEDLDVVEDVEPFSVKPVQQVPPVAAKPEAVEDFSKLREEEQRSADAEIQVRF